MKVKKKRDFGELNHSTGSGGSLDSAQVGRLNTDRGGLKDTSGLGGAVCLLLGDGEGGGCG